MTNRNEPTPIPHEPSLVEAGLGLDAVSVCARLTAVLADASHGWRVAADALSGEEQLAERLRDIARRREDFAVELSNVVSGRSGTVGDNPHTLSGTLRTWWLEIRASMSHGDRTAILNVCRSGSRAAVAEYDRALGTALPDPIREIIVRQANELRATGQWLRTIE